MPLTVKKLPDVRRIPDDLAALGHRESPYPADVPLDPDQARTALWLSAGNIGRAAVLRHTNAARLGNLVRRDAFLAEQRAQAAELALDRAEGVLLDALDDQDPVRRDDAARFVLVHAGRARGWSRDGNAQGINVAFSGSPGASGAVQIRWQTRDEAAAKTIRYG
jgi:hypothetical protein